MIKGVIMAVFGVGVVIEAVHKIIAHVVPRAETMGIIGLLALLGNGLCFLLLFRHRSDDLNMRSTWPCSWNDVIANLSVLAATGGVAYFHSMWPDVLVGGIIAVLFLRTALTVLAESAYEYRNARLNPKRQFGNLKVPLRIRGLVVFRVNYDLPDSIREMRVRYEFYPIDKFPRGQR